MNGGVFFWMEGSSLWSHKIKCRYTHTRNISKIWEVTKIPDQRRGCRRSETDRRSSPLTAATLRRTQSIVSSSKHHSNAALLGFMSHLLHIVLLLLFSISATVSSPPDPLPSCPHPPLPPEHPVSEAWTKQQHASLQPICILQEEGVWEVLALVLDYVSQPVVELQRPDGAVRGGKRTHGGLELRTKLEEQRAHRVRMNQTASVSHQIDCQPAKDTKVGAAPIVESWEVWGSTLRRCSWGYCEMRIVSAGEHDGSLCRCLSQLCTGN